VCVYTKVCACHKLVVQSPPFEIAISQENVIQAIYFFLHNSKLACFPFLHNLMLHITVLIFARGTEFSGIRGDMVVMVLCYKSEGRWFDFRWCHWNFSLT